MSRPTSTTDRAAALAFIAAQQDDPSTATAYVGTLADDLEEDLDGLDQPWLETLRVCVDAAGQITGAACVEWDDEVGLAWVYGPWATAETWDEDAPALLDAMVAQADVAHHELYAAEANTRLAALAERVGWKVSPTNYELAVPRERLARPDAGIRPAEAGDLSGIAALHGPAFPDTYATPEQLVEPGGTYTTLVARDGDAVTGYVAGQPSGDDAYLDFVVVAPDSRGAGLGTRLLGALADALPGERVRLTCSERDAAALRLYERLGFERLSATRGYRSGQADDR